MTANENTGQIILKARLKMKLTQLEAAEKAGIHWNTLAKIERGEQAPSFATAKKLGRVLNINLNNLPD